MTCKHKNIKSVNCELFCIDCGEKLPAGYFTDADLPAKTAAEPAANVEPNKEPAPEADAAKTGKKPGRKKVVK